MIAHETGERLLVQWDEAFSMGVADITAAHYPKLPEGNYHFRAAGFDIYDNPTGANASLAVFVPPPFWKMCWFWSAIGASLFVAAAGTGRYFVWRRMRGEVSRLKSQQALEKERWRSTAPRPFDEIACRVLSFTKAICSAGPPSPAC